MKMGRAPQTSITFFIANCLVSRQKGGGKPCIRGLRITVYDLLTCLASGMSHQEILEDFPDLIEADILACLGYAADREHIV